VYYVCLLESHADPAQRYVGVTSDLKSRLLEDNSGKPTHREAPALGLITYVAFSERSQAEALSGI
jgi:predicted GIY-YIG superfamily endonuclease